MFPSFDFNFIVDLRCGVSVSSGRWLFSVFLAVPVLVPPKGSVARSSSPMILSAEQRHNAQDSVFSSHDFDLSSSTVSVCWSPFSLRLGAPPGTAGPRPPTGAVSQPARLARAARARVDLLCRSTNAPGFPLILLEPGLCPVNPSLSVGLPALIQFPLE
jgi:hypothetical protein